MCVCGLQMLACPAAVTITASPGRPKPSAECITVSRRRLISLFHSVCDIFTEPVWTVVCNIDFITHTAEPGCCTAAFKWDIRLLFLFFSIGFHGTLFPPHSMDPHRETEEINKRKNRTQLHTHSLTSGFILAGSSSRDADALEGFPHASIRQE